MSNAKMNSVSQDSRQCRGSLLVRRAANEKSTPAILFILPWRPDSVGGVTEVVINLYKWFGTRSSFRPTLLVNAYPFRRIARAWSRTIGPIDLFYLPTPVESDAHIRSMISFGFRLPSTLNRLANYFRRMNVCAINVHYPSLSVAAVLLARRIVGRNIRVVLSFHGSDVAALRGISSIQRGLWRLVIGSCDAIIACSRALGHEIEKTFPGIGAKLHVVHNGVDGTGCRDMAQSANLPEELRGRPFIASVGTFEEKKGHDVLIHSFRELAPEFPDLRLVLAGRSGSTLTMTQTLLIEAGLQDRIFVYPDRPHDQTLALIAGARLFVLPSRIEPFGIVILEAASLGTPVVATRVGGIPEIVEDEYSGLLVPPDSPADLSRGIRMLLRNPGIAETYASNLRSVVDSGFSWRHAANRYAAVLNVPRPDCV
jgi:glycosyltransferase involved in cell wall biosynthesis